MKRVPSTKKIVSRLAIQLRGKLNDANDWTPEVFKAAAALFRRKEDTVHAARRKTTGRWSTEYLVDLCISESLKGDKNDPFTYRQLLLALECEWAPSQSSLKYDFCKLADVRAARRIFVGWVRNEGSAEQFVEAAKQFLSTHAQVTEGEQYGLLLFSGSAPTPHAWVIQRGSKSCTLVRVNVAAPNSPLKKSGTSSR